MEITSSAFQHFGMIPKKYTCDGENINPPLSVLDAPAETQSLAIIMDDPDAPGGLFTHWVIWNIDAGVGMIAEGEVPSNSVEGINSANTIGYFGPCPPSGTHHYHFRFYALDKVLEIGPDSGKDELIEAMDGHVLASEEFVGLYSRGEAV
ncbi:MAG: YbhB/YbcL family Raf kinase inhibitor-like protein [Patescibacteria group bacterium]